MGDCKVELILQRVRLAFPALYEPRAIGNDATSKPAYGCKLIIDPASDGAKALHEAVRKVAREHPKWAGKGDQIFEQLLREGKVCYSTEPYRNKDGDIYDGFEGMHMLSCRSEKLKPTVKDRFNNDVTEGQTGAPYAGCIGHAAVDVWAQDNQWGRRINCTLQGFMFVEDAPAFSGGRAATDDTFKGLAQAPAAADFV